MIYNKEINGVKFTFVCESWRTRNSWGHQVTLYKNDIFTVGRAKIRYYNRSWESYLYQSAIKSVIYDAIEEIKAAAKVAFKALHNYQVMTKKRAAEFSEYLTKDPAYNIYCFNRRAANNLQPVFIFLRPLVPSLASGMEYCHGCTFAPVLVPYSIMLHTLWKIIDFRVFAAVPTSGDSL